MPETVISYIDGFNLYFGIRKSKWTKYYWLDVEKLSINLLAKDQYLVEAKYFTSPIRGNANKQKRQSTFLEATECMGVKPIKGKYRINPYECRDKSVTHYIPVEKMTDVNIAVQMVIDGMKDKYDTALLITGDIDLIPAIRAVKRECRNKKVIVAFPPNRVCDDFNGIADECKRINEYHLKRSLLPPQITKPDGYVLTCPSQWLTKPISSI